MDPLELLLARAERSGVFLDFDGTLSEIAPTPGEAAAVPGAAGVLAGLAERFALAAVVSGRRAAEVAERLGHPPGVRIFGLYGLETDAAMDGPEPPAPALEEILPRVLDVAATVPGSLVEPKGSNLAVHYRLAPQTDLARTALLEALGPLAGDVGMRLIEGKRVVELVPAASPSKGDVVEREGAGLEAALYAGDDLADIEAFAAVDRLVSNGAKGIKVAVASEETPPALLDAADIVVEGPTGLVDLLRSLLR